MLTWIFQLSLTTLLLSTQSVRSHKSRARAHRLDRRQFDVKEQSEELHYFKKRENGRATFYTPDVGACGKSSSSSDYVVALNQPEYGDINSVSSKCFKEILVTYGSKSHTATIMDVCPECDEGALDMSPALFDYFAPASMGVFYMSWDYTDGDGGDDGGDQTTTTTKKTTTTTTTTTTTWTPTTTTTTTSWTSTTWSSSATTTQWNSTSISGNLTSTTSTSLNATSTSVSANTTMSNSTTSSTPTSTTWVPSFTGSNFENGSINSLFQVYLGFAGLLSQIANEAENS